MSSAMFDLILQATLDTLYMVAVSGVIATLLGLPLGVMLYVTRPRQIMAMPSSTRHWASSPISGVRFRSSF